MTDTFDPSNNPESDRGTPESGDEMQPFEAQFASDSPVATDDGVATEAGDATADAGADAEVDADGPAAEAGAELLEDAEVIEIEDGPGVGAEPVRPPGSLVRRAHLRRLREQGEVRTSPAASVR